MSQPFVNFTGVGAALPMPNINTDAIIPASYLRSASADLAKGLFGALRFDETGAERADFVLNRPPYRAAKIFFGGENFGCGSSREAAAWALKQFGIGAVFAPSFADIFYENAFRNGLLAGRIAAATLAQLVALAAGDGGEPVFAVDLHLGTITHAGGAKFTFEIAPARRDALLRGDDEISMTLVHDAEITAFHAAGVVARPWLHSPPTGKTSP
jgi:3-isopropylmalate/(R)-2-methylmalate dehydratase small subunit